jgi:hypothetical protein
MGLTYSFTFSAAANLAAAELERFLKSVEADAKKMGFGPTLVFGATFKTPEQQDFARRIRVVLLRKGQAVDFDAVAGRCRVLPKEAVVLVVTDERQNETVFGFARYPKALKDANGRPLLTLPFGERWHFSDFIKSPDPRLRSIVKRFADAGYVEAETDDFNPAKPLTQEQFDGIIAANQEIQKRNPFGSEAHRKAYEAIRKAVKDFKGHDIGEYSE